jgi:hypothetical protein
VPALWRRLRSLPSDGGTPGILWMFGPFLFERPLTIRVLVLWLGRHDPSWISSWTGLLLSSSLLLTTAWSFYSARAALNRIIQTTHTDDETRFLRRSNTSQVKNVSRVRHLMWVEVGIKVTRKNRARSHPLYPAGARQRPYMRNLMSSFAYSGPMQASSKSWRNNGCSASLLQALRAILPAAATSETEGLQAAGYFILPHDQRQQLPLPFLSFGSWE